MVLQSCLDVVTSFFVVLSTYLGGGFELAIHSMHSELRLALGRASPSKWINGACDDYVVEYKNKKNNMEWISCPDAAWPDILVVHEFFRKGGSRFCRSSKLAF